MDTIYTIENTIGRALKNSWKAALSENTWDAWNKAYITIKGMWLLGLFSDEFELEEYTNMLMQVCQLNRTQAQLDGRV